MCKFFSCISNGKGKVLFFLVDNIQKIQKAGNPKNYNWNSHTSIANFYNVDEDKWNKWEYNPETKEVKLDGGLITKCDDKDSVLDVCNKYFTSENALYLQKLYLNNSGNYNSGNYNSGDYNSGYFNSGNSNSGNCNSGNYNSGDSNSGDYNSGYSNSGNYNSGYFNSGNSNSGNWNSGYFNSGNSNSGNCNSGNRNSGNWNSGDWNSGYFNIDTPKVRIFGKETNVKKANINFPSWLYFDLNVWVNVNEMSDKEKETYYWYKTTNSYLRKLEYKEAFKLAFEKANVKGVKDLLKLPNFNYKIFEEISGISKKMIQYKLKE
jgi:hypothetical protein